MVLSCDIYKYKKDKGENEIDIIECKICSSYIILSSIGKWYNSKINFFKNREDNNIEMLQCIKCI